MLVPLALYRAGGAGYQRREPLDREGAVADAAGTSRKLALGAGVAALALVALEAAARLVDAVAPDLLAVTPEDPGAAFGVMMQPDPALLWRLTPGELVQAGVQVRINADGLRGAPLELRPGERRILFTGDSSVFGWAVREEQAYASRVAAALQRIGTRARAVNAGVPGYSSAQSRFQLDGLLDVARPDVVVIANLWSDMMRTGWSDAELFARFGAPAHARALRVQGTLGHSALFRLVQATVLGLRSVPSDRRILWNTVLDGDPGATRTRGTAAEHRANLEAMAAAATVAGARVVTLVLPVNTTGEHPPDAVLAPYHQNLRAVGAAHAGCVDMPAAWAALDAAAIAARFVDRVHPSALGHDEIASALTPAVQEALR